MLIDYRGRDHLWQNQCITPAVLPLMGGGHVAYMIDNGEFRDIGDGAQVIFKCPFFSWLTRWRRYMYIELVHRTSG